MSLRYAFLGLWQLILQDVGNRQVDIKDVPSAVRYIRWECHFGMAKKKKTETKQHSQPTTIFSNFNFFLKK